MKTSRFFLAILLAAAACTEAATLVTPQQLEFDGKTWQLSNQLVTDKEDVYQYTTDGESAAGWTRMITLQRIASARVTPLEWNRKIKTGLDHANVLDYQLSERTSDMEATATIVYPPNAKYPIYESDAWRTRYVAGCAGMVSWKVARQVPAASADASDFEKQNVRTLASDAASKDMRTLLDTTWSPECK